MKWQLRDGGIDEKFKKSSLVFGLGGRANNEIDAAFTEAICFQGIHKTGVPSITTSLRRRTGRLSTRGESSNNNTSSNTSNSNNISSW